MRTALFWPASWRGLVSSAAESSSSAMIPTCSRQTIKHGLEADLCVISGGLGPTHDDRTIEFLAKATGRPLTSILSSSARSTWSAAATRETSARPTTAYDEGVRKQASIPERAHVLGLAGTAPGIALEHERCVAVALPGPPNRAARALAAARSRASRSGDCSSECRRSSGAFCAFRAVGIDAGGRYRDAGGEGGGITVTICARDRELSVSCSSSPAPSRAPTSSRSADRRRRPEALFARDERPIEEIVLELARESSSRWQRPSPARAGSSPAG